MHRWLLLGVLGASACPLPAETDTEGPVDTEETDTEETDTGPELPDSVRRTARVTLDGVPVEGATVLQAGIDVLHHTDASGEVALDVDLTLDAEWVLVAGHPEARQEAIGVDPDDDVVLEIALTRFDPRDNLEYAFQDPGTPDRRGSTAQCAHCHQTFNDDWWSSPHRSATSNVHVQDLYAGVTTALADARTCTEAGGTWASGLEPGTREATERCYLGAGVLPDLDPSCAPNCDGRTEVTGDCAACHAPGIDGETSGRDLLEATGFAFEAGVHCDVCHKVEQVDPEDPVPGVAGRLSLLRPSEEAFPQIAGPWVALQFGPHHDSPNPRMGSVQRDHFEDGRICAGCHELEQQALVPDTVIDTARWPSGRIPVHSTWSEWSETPFADRVPCNACHMPPAPELYNSADLQLLINSVGAGVAAGWVRPSGATRHHSWVGPRAADSRMLQLAAAVDVSTRVEGEVLVVDVTTSNVGAGHRLPTGEPARQVVLHVQATCDGVPLQPVGGDAIPPWVGATALQSDDGDWTLWPEAQVGDTVRVLGRSGWREDPGFGPFGDGTFTGAARGLPRWEVLGLRTVTRIDAGRVTLDGPLPEGDLALLGPPWTLPDGASRATAAAGAPGHAFARVLTDAEGGLAVPHHRAVDVVSDNRLAPHTSVETTHRFAASCDAPDVTARLTWRAHPASLASEKRWENPEIVMTEARR